MMTIADLKNWFSKHRSEIKEEYFRFLRFASISADPAYRDRCEHCAQWLAEFMRQGGLQTELISTPGLPLVYAEDLSAGPQTPTLLLYGHYDVQPIDPAELWISPPFEPTERNGSVYARGAVDDKGQILYAIFAVLCWKKMGRSLPVNVKFCIEGEEESHSTGLFQMLEILGKKMRADYLLVVDFDQFDRDMPAVSLGGRGLVSLEVTLIGSHTDLHSGLYGGVAYNPNRALVELLAKLWDAEGRVQVPGFYDDVVDVPEKERSMFACRYGKEDYAKACGIEAFGGEKGRTLHEANCFRPTLELNGISGGYTGAGMKTVIPAAAQAKISCRLVPHQNPETIGRSIAQFLRQNAVPGMKIEVVQHEGDSAFRGERTSKLTQAIAKASSEVAGVECRYILSGASIPIVPELVKATGAQMVGMGYGLIDDEIHAPNEHFDMHRFEQGFLTVGRALALL
ncbi:MAG: dipeptidase [Chlamydiia bacterium]|nr:dipeptidase [Chlamydiia bacterium]